MSTNKNIYVGAMSGTSHDAIDVSILKSKRSHFGFLSFKTHSKLIKNQNKKYYRIGFGFLNELGQLNKKLDIYLPRL